MAFILWLMNFTEKQELPSNLRQGRMRVFWVTWQDGGHTAIAEKPHAARKLLRYPL